MKKLIFVLAILGVLVSCNTENRTPLVSTEQEPANIMTMDSVIGDTTKVINIHTPYLLDSARQILLHEVHLSELGPSKTRYKINKRDYYEDRELINIIFEDLNKKSSHLLTNQRVKIHSKQFVNNSNNNNNETYILYKLVDADYNRDGKLNGEDIESLYISNLDGTSFKKITKNNEDYRDGAWIGALSRYYYRTGEDSNNDGYFDSTEKMHHYYIQFNNDGYDIVEYKPLDILANK